MSKAVSAMAATLARIKAAKMTKAERTAHARRMAQARWAKAKADAAFAAAEHKANGDVSAFRAEAERRGWKITPAVEKKMAELGWRGRFPSRPLTTPEAVAYLSKLYLRVVAKGEAK